MNVSSVFWRWKVSLSIRVCNDLIDQVFLDSLLLYNPTIGSTALTWLRRYATTNSPEAILNAIAKLEFLNIQNGGNIAKLSPGAK
jgi:hypothetical protein